MNLSDIMRHNSTEPYIREGIETRYHVVTIRRSDNIPCGYKLQGLLYGVSHLASQNGVFVCYLAG